LDDHSPQEHRQGTPFPFEGPVPPALLIDREEELALLARRAADRVNVRVVAPRRYGKTSVLLAHAARLRQTGWRSAHVDFSRVTDLTDAARRLAAGYAALDAPWIRSHMHGLLSRLGATLTTAGPGLTLAPRSGPGDAQAAETVLHRLLDLPLTLWRQDSIPTLVVFDEFQDLLVAREDLDGLLRSRIQYHSDAAAYVYAGSEPSLMRELFEKRERPFFGQAQPLALEPLPVTDAFEGLAARFHVEGLDPGESLGELVAFAGGHPQRTMLLAYLLADRLADGSPGDALLASEIIDQAVRDTGPAHQALWQQLGRSERVILGAVADGIAPTNANLAAEHQLARTTLNDAAERLASQGHLLRAARGSTPVDPLLGEWLRRR
jgi:hypothetical protein